MEWLPRNRTEQAMEIGRRVVAAYARRFQEAKSLNAHFEAVRTLDILTRSQAEREADQLADYWPDYYEDFTTAETPLGRPVPDQLTIHFEGLDIDPLECD